MRVLMTLTLVIIHISTFSQNLLPFSKMTHRADLQGNLYPHQRELMRYDDRNNLIYKASYNNSNNSPEPNWLVFRIEKLYYNKQNQLSKAERESYRPVQPDEESTELASNNTTTWAYNENGDIREILTEDTYINQSEENTSWGKYTYVYNDMGCLIRHTSEINNLPNINNGDWYELSRTEIILDESCNELFWEVYEGGKFATSREIQYDETGDIVFDEYKSYLNETQLAASYTTILEKDHFFRITYRSVQTNDYINDYNTISEVKSVYSNKPKPDSTFSYTYNPGFEDYTISVHQYDNEDREISTHIYQGVNGKRDSLYLLRESEYEYAFDNRLAYYWSKYYEEEKDSYRITEQTTNYTDDKKLLERLSVRSTYEEDRLVDQRTDKYDAIFDCAGLLKKERNFTDDTEYWRTEFNYPLTSACEDEGKRFTNIQFLQNLEVIDIWTQFLSGLDTDVQLISIDGRIVNQLSTSNRLHLSLPIQNLSSGIYFLHLQNENTSIVEPLWLTDSY